MASKPIEVAALGRPLYPGMLYDCRSDTFIPGVTLWDKKSLSEDLDRHPQPMTDLKVSCSDSLSDKSNLLDVSASLKASFLGGLVEVGGSAKFLSDTKSSNQQSRVTMNHKETTRFEQLTMSHLGSAQITYPEVFDQKTATHVVTGVLYGAQAVMVFDRTFSEEENKQEIEGELNVMVNKIPGFSIEGKGALEMTEEDKEKAERISCTFHGDVRLDQNPTNYIEALEVYKKLPTILKENPDNAVPVKVWLYPLSLLDTKAAQLVRGITTRLVSNTEDIIEGLLEAERTCNDLSRKPLVNVFRDIKERLSSFQGSLNIYKTVLMKAVARVLPAIRGGKMEEKSLEDILKIHYSSPFKADMLNQWLNDAKFELDLLSSQIKKLEGIKTEDSNHLKILLSDPDIDVVVCLTFTSMKYEDQYLSTLKKFLESEEFKKLDEVVKKSSSMFISEEWFNDPDVISKMRENLSLFKSFSEANKDEKRYRFIISAISDPSSPGSSIYLYEKGKLTDTQFQPVSKPPPPEVKEVKERSVSLKLQKSPTGETVQYRVEYKQVKEEEWLVRNTPDEDFTLTGLEFGQQYRIRYRIVGKVGVSEASDTIGPIPPSGTDPKTRNDFLQYSHQFTLDLNTVNKNLSLSESNRVITFTYTPQSYPDHPDRFAYDPQVLCRESNDLTIMDAASSVALTEFINHSISRMDQQQESISSTGRAVQALVTQVSELSQQLQQLRNPTAPPAPSVPPSPPDQGDHPEPRLPVPSLTRPRTFEREETKVAFVLTLLTGQAALWGTAVWENRVPCCSSFQALAAEMKRVFDRAVAGKEAARQLTELKQGHRVVAEYSIEFRSLAAECRWNEEAQWDVFLHGLADRFHKEIYVLDLPPDLNGLIELALRVDSRLNRLERLSRPHGGASGSEVRAVGGGDTVSPALDPEPMQEKAADLSNASEVGVCAVLSQRSPSDDKMHPCAFYSHRLSPAERNYDIGNRELLAVKLALEEWRHCATATVQNLREKHRTSSPSWRRAITAPSNATRSPQVADPRILMLLDP
ncbi:uncharacterized protein LOC125244430 [Megalobrama amblycephala]|uniref:uncharacterized protein LOC125244430 n=1 Tax=Megalobrama amblycephala TaxID=75352 RepID=UPI002014274B|nr:uncharacterized protein LOC125244430 [Megalobrama amblycephala]